MSSGSDSEEDQNNNRKVNSAKRKKFDISLKLEAVAYAKKHSKRAAATHFGVDKRCIADWTQKEILLVEKESVCKSAKRLSGGGRKVVDPQFDQQMYNWVLEQRQKKMKVSRRLLRNKALSVKINSDFKASNGWVDFFLKRHNLVHRKITTVSQKAPEEYEIVIADYLLYLSNQRKENNYTHIYACDETGVFIESGENRTITQKGVSDVPILVSGNQKFRVTVLLTARHDGYPLKPFVLLQRKRPDKKIAEQFRGKLHLHWAGTSWMNNDCIALYLDSVFGQSIFNVKRCLVWDSFRAHISEETKKKMKEIKLDSVVIPGGTTKFLQPPDTHWNQPFKAVIKKKYEDWIMESEKPKTKGGNTKGPLMSVYLQWILDAWNHLSSEYIQKSFFECGITTDLDGKDDSEILCIKKHVPNVLSILKERRGQLAVDQMAREISQLKTYEIDQDEDINNGFDSDDSLESLR